MVDSKFSLDHFDGHKNPKGPKKGCSSHILVPQKKFSSYGAICFKSPSLTSASNTTLWHFLDFGVHGNKLEKFSIDHSNRLVASYPNMQ
jgi:hypothetical protein